MHTHKSKSLIIVNCHPKSKPNSWESLELRVTRSSGWGRSSSVLPPAPLRRWLCRENENHKLTVLKRNCWNKTRVLEQSFSIVNQHLDLSPLFKTFTVLKYTFQLQYHKCMPEKSYRFALANSKRLQALWADFRWLSAMNAVFLIRLWDTRLFLWQLTYVFRRGKTPERP